MNLPDKILFVDDEAPILRAFARTMQRGSYATHTAQNAEQAMRLAEQNVYGVVALDYRMPGVNGLELREELRDRLPDASFVLISGNCNLDLAMNAVNEHDISYVVKKPWATEELVTTINRAMEESWERAASRRVIAEVVQSKEAHSLASQVAIAATPNQIAGLLFGVIELRDPAMARHCMLTSQYATILATEMGIDREARNTLRIAGLLHDIGKVGLPDAVLHKPGAPTLDEWAMIHTHSESGAALLNGIVQMEAVRRIIVEHHEHWDGEGYPKGLHDIEICMGARILAVAEAIDTMLTDRPYQRGATWEVVRQELIRCSGSHYDPEVIKCVLTLPASTWLDIRGQTHQLAPASIV